ncbi:unnamed protein product [Bursaphelenchus okinawaensis]|uniref:Peptidase A1 domain-containing protein n=1 Tax=Bursaphelenchus okinawaensis TaxID=465554 RepID=A0A811K0T2_9BILA|nr:unnamed protein product [Bursaphelenchus okinawaensis]CAG9089424.1 unnamed protein product [Bursaphelenchus okinawaensis]
MKTFGILLLFISTAHALTSTWTETLHFTKNKLGNLELIVDLSSSSSFLIEARCENCPFRGINRRFFPEKSASFEEAGSVFEKNFDENLNNGKGGVLGYTGKDVVGNTKTQRDTFGLVKRLNTFYDPAETLNRDRVAGRLGLALKTKDETNLLDIFFEGIDKKLVCFAPKCYKDQNGFDHCENNVSKGTFPDQLEYKNITQVKVIDTRQEFWEFKVEAFSHPSTSSKSFNAILSTTTSDFTIPAEIFNTLKLHYSAFKNKDGLYQVDCSHRDRNTHFAFTINGVNVPISSDKLIGYDIWSKTCHLRAKPAVGFYSNTWVFGTVFTDSIGICLDFDDKQINFIQV